MTVIGVRRVITNQTVVFLLCMIAAITDGGGLRLLGACGLEREFADLVIIDAFQFVFIDWFTLLLLHGTRKSSFRVLPDDLDVNSDRLLRDDLIVVNVDDEGRFDALTALEIFGVLYTTMAKRVILRVRVVG
ncbi:hypothetical protein BC567DRAFT_214665 [Phyllosticta citribraziliensis]